MQESKLTSIFTIDNEKQSEQYKHLTLGEEKLTSLLAKNDDYVFSKEEIAYFSDGIEHTINNIDFNDRIGKQLRISKDSELNNSLNILRTLSFKSTLVDDRKMDELIKKFDNINNLAENINGQQVNKLTSDDLNSMFAASSLLKILQGGSITGEIINNTAYLKHIKDVSTKLNEKSEQLKDMLTRDINLNIKPGDIFLYDANIRGLLHKEKNGILEILLKFFDKYAGHFGVLFFSQNNEITSSEMWDGEHQNNKLASLDPATLISTEYYKINPLPLINAEFTKILAKAGIELDYSGIFADSTNKLHENLAKSDLKVNANVIVQTVVASLKPFGHTRLFARDDNFQKVHDRMYGIGEYTKENQFPKGKDEMTCISFTTKSTIAALYETNLRLKLELIKQLSEKLDKQLIEEAAAQNKSVSEIVLEKYGIDLDKDEKAIEKIIIKEYEIDLDKIEIIHIPISKRERLSKVTPGDFMKAMVNAGCLEKHTFMDNYFDFKHHNKGNGLTSSEEFLKETIINAINDTLKAASEDGKSNEEKLNAITKSIKETIYSYAKEKGIVEERIDSIEYAVSKFSEQCLKAMSIKNLSIREIQIEHSFIDLLKSIATALGLYSPDKTISKEIHSIINTISSSRNDHGRE